ncbi:EamA family transporter [Promicromonospora thailandica]|uniref:O-acetylserine/cysteine efflux transporter n=1 Tax=Promicromonospora thailandica TaxID=765201 RepID=A0A9X2JUG8_9MICO|nr:EamA family transporter [Promicromonospora thailandica]MCP2263447.1 O-acetylserine/cysteine efflux transporter [Promicromonospora thailandica]BFF19386.1 O-acetylserine/cysteine exporter [Promicromonospora thailandica]
MPLRHSLLAVLVMIIWGTNFLAIDVGVADVPPALFVAIRFVVVLLPAIFLVPRPAAPLKDVLVVGLFLSLGQFGLMYTAIWLDMPPGLASLVLQAQVVFTVLFATVALRERPTTPQLVGVALGAVGLVVVGLGRSAATPGVAFLLTLAAAASWATGNVIVRRLGTATQAAGTRQGPLAGLSMTVWSALVVPVPMFALAVLLDGPSAVGYSLTHPTWPAVLSTLYTAWLASLVGYGVWNTLLARYRAGAVVPFTMLVPVVGMTAAWLAFGEVPNAAEVGGGLLLLLGVAITSGLLRWPPTRSRPGVRA